VPRTPCFATTAGLNLLIKLYKNNKGILMLNIGDYTYGKPEVSGTISNVIIGKFCSIADKVKINVGIDHNIRNISTYPFNIQNIRTVKNGVVSFNECKNINRHPVSKGDVVIGNDVWIASGV
jgi:acetyltransferase-like isoleucine patch superfamily enzyme